MNLAELWKVVYERFAYDEDEWYFLAETPMVTGVYNTIAPVNAAYPYIVYTVAGNAQDDGFRFDKVDVVVRFAIYHEMRHTAHSAMQRCEAIIDRIYGNAMGNEDGVPTHGFHRWLPEFAQGWNPTVFHRTGSNEQHDEDHLVFIEEYAISISKPRFTPG